MKIIRDSSFIDNSKYNVCTVGYFDGVHLGHKKIIERLVSDAKKNNGKSILVSFWPHPRRVLYPNDHFDFIQSNDIGLFIFILAVVSSYTLAFKKLARFLVIAR